MVDDLAVTDTCRRSLHIRQPRKMFEVVAAPVKGKRKRATDGGNVVPATAVTTPRKRATRAISGIASNAPPPQAPKDKRKREAEDTTSTATDSRLKKKRATRRAASVTAPTPATAPVSIVSPAPINLAAPVSTALVQEKARTTAQRPERFFGPCLGSGPKFGQGKPRE